MGFLSERIPGFIQMGIAVALFSMAYQHVATGNYKFPEVNTMERRMAFAMRCLAISICPLVVALGIMGTN